MSKDKIPEKIYLHPSLPEEERERLTSLRNAIEEGIKSGINEDFNPIDHLKKLKSKSGKK